MKINSSIEINISALKQDISADIKVEDIKYDLISEGAVVQGRRDEDGTIIMIISGDIDTDEIHDVFMEDAAVDYEDYVMNDYPDYDDDYDDVEVFDSKKNKFQNHKSVNEKKTGCCPGKNKKNIMLSLSEALSGVKPSEKKVTLDEVIDNISHKGLSESVASAALNKIKKENKENYLLEKLGADKYNKVMKSLKEGKKTIFGNTKINGKKISEYSTTELGNLLEKVSNQIKNLKNKISAGINESDELSEAEKTLNLKNKIYGILDDEITYRNAIKEADDDTNSTDNMFRDLNPNATDDTDSKDESNEDKDADSKDDSDENKDSEEDKENPDEDETVELSSIVVTLTDEDAANKLKDDLVNKGIPADDIEISKVEDEDEEKDEDSDKESEKSDEDKDTDEDKSDEDKKEESLNVNKSNSKMNEDDENSDEKSDDDKDSDTDADKDDENKDEDKSDDSTEQYKLTLTNTDYIDEFEDVLMDIYGFTKDEINDFIGGEIVKDDDNDEDKDDEDKDDSSEDSDKKDEKSDTEDSADDLDPDKMFAGI